MQAPLLARTLDDGALARAIAAAGTRLDTGAEAELYRRLAPRVRLYGLRHLRDRAAAADLVQQVMLMTLERLRAGRVRDPDRIASFVLGTCRMVVLELRRGGARREALLETYGEHEEAAATQAQSELDREKLAGCLQALAERERTVVLLSFYAERAAGDVARELALTPENVRVIRHRALRKLRGCLGAGDLS